MTLITEVSQLNRFKEIGLLNEKYRVFFKYLLNLETNIVIVILSLYLNVNRGVLFNFAWRKEGEILYLQSVVKND